MHESLEDQLKNAQITPTPQRIELAGLLLSRPQHFSADQVLQMLRERGSAISKATVYNTLKLFRDRNLIREVAVDPTRLIYDSTTRAHHHFYNEDTGELIDIAPTELALARLPDLPAGTEAAAVEVVVRLRNTRGA
jgi:Fur family iron response transcriptional regulator